MSDEAMAEYMANLRQKIREKEVSNMVQHPPHYTAGSVECIEAIQAALTPEEFAGYCKACVMKYVWRERMKGGLESLEKAQWYLQRLIDNYHPGGKDGVE